jgi:hypothetical protein
MASYNSEGRYTSEVAMPKPSPRQRKTMGRVMHEFKHGELKSGAGGRPERSKVAVKPLPSRLRRPAPRNTKAKARTSAISQNPNARKPSVIRINRSAKASRTWAREDGEKAAQLWAERMRRGQRGEDANLRARKSETGASPLAGD